MEFCLKTDSSKNKREIKKARKIKQEEEEIDHHFALGSASPGPRAQMNCFKHYLYPSLAPLRSCLLEEHGCCQSQSTKGYSKRGPLHIIILTTLLLLLLLQLLWLWGFFL